MSSIIAKDSVSKLQVAYLLFAIVCLLPFVSAGIALIIGIAFSLLFGNPYADVTRSLTHRLLQISVIGLGAGMNLLVVWKVGFHGIGYTAIGILFAIGIGLVLGKLFNVERNISLLICVGTAICGGSAIAAVAPTIRAKPHEVSVALATVFCLNAAALFIFPSLGHYFDLSQSQFGLWSALAIHDTSSVVGAALQYGSYALNVATPVKLARALWIIPISLLAGSFWNWKHQEHQKVKPKYPWFLLGFLLLAAIMTLIPELQSVGSLIYSGAKRLLVLTLFLIGSGLTRVTVRSVGVKPFFQGFSLWLAVGSGTLVAIKLAWIQ